MGNRGLVRVLVTTERFLFYRNSFDISECQNLVFVGTPERPELYELGLSWVSPFNERKGKVKKVTTKAGGSSSMPVGEKEGRELTEDKT